MTSRNRRGNRLASMKARLAIGAAVLVGGGAIGVAVAASGHGAASTAASAGYSTSFSHYINEGSALNSALSEWGRSQSKSLTTLSEMQPVSKLATSWHGKTEFAAQRGIVVLATKKFLLVQSSNGKLDLWWLDGTKSENVSGSLAGLAVLTGSLNKAVSLLVHNNPTPAVSTMAGSTGVAAKLTAPTTPTTTISVNTGTSTVTITITSSSAAVTAPTTTPVTTAGTSMTSVSSKAAVGGSRATSWQSTWASTAGITRGDLVFVAGVKEHDFLVAKLALFTGLNKTTTTTPTASATPTAAASATPSPNSTVMGTHS